MTSINQTSLILLALDKTIVDNYERLTDEDVESLTRAITDTITGKPIPQTKGETNADAIRNR